MGFNIHFGKMSKWAEHPIEGLIDTPTGRAVQWDLHVVHLGRDLTVRHHTVGREPAHSGKIGVAAVTKSSDLTHAHDFKQLLYATIDGKKTSLPSTSPTTANGVHRTENMGAGIITSPAGFAASTTAFGSPPGGPASGQGYPKPAAATGSCHAHHSGNRHARSRPATNKSLDFGAAEGGGAAAHGTTAVDTAGSTTTGNDSSDARLLLRCVIAACWFAANGINNNA